MLPVGGDVIVAFDGETVFEAEELIRKIRKQRPGDKVTLKILRNGGFRELQVVLGVRLILWRAALRRTASEV